jgi:hypothetical protein
MVYRDMSLRMGKDKMADFTYALLMTGAELTSSWCMGYDFSRKQNAFNEAAVRIHIREVAIPVFEEITGIKLEVPPKISGCNADIREQRDEDSYGGCSAR